MSERKPSRQEEQLREKYGNQPHRPSGGLGSLGDLLGDKLEIVKKGIPVAAVAPARPAPAAQPLERQNHPKPPAVNNALRPPASHSQPADKLARRSWPLGNSDHRPAPPNRPPDRPGRPEHQLPGNFRPASGKPSSVMKGKLGALERQGPRRSPPKPTPAEIEDTENQKIFLQFARDIMEEWAAGGSSNEPGNLSSQIYTLYPEFSRLLHQRHHEFGITYLDVEQFLKTHLASEFTVRVEKTDKGLAISPEQSSANEVKKRLEELSQGKLGLLPKCFTDGVMDPGRIPIAIGLDFGTSSTKAVYNIVDENRSYPVRFTQASNGSEYLLEKSLHLDLASRILSLGPRPGSRPGQPFPSLKKLINTDKQWTNMGDIRQQVRIRLEHLLPAAKHLSDRDLSEFLTAVQLTFTLWRIRLAIEKDFVEVHGQKHVAFGFSVNMCVPSNHYRHQDDAFRDPVCFANHAALAAANQLFAQFSEQEFQSNSISLDKAWNCWHEEIRHFQCLADASDTRPTRVSPEAMAAAAGYIQSRNSQPGHYMLIDIGAGTTDVSLFSINQDKHPTVFEAYCSEQGVEELEATIVQAAPEALRPQIAELLRRHKQEVLDNNATGKYPRLASPHDKACEDKLRSHRLAIQDQIKDVWSKANFESTFNQHRHVLHNFTFFLGGGGSHLRDIDEIGKVLEHNYLVGEKTAVRLPPPSETEFMMPKHTNTIWFHRLAVAYGLSVMPDIHKLPGDVRLPPNNGPQRPAQSMWWLWNGARDPGGSVFTDRFIDKDQM